MIKTILATLLAVTAFSAGAVDVGLLGEHDFNGAQHANGVGLTLGQNFGKFNVTAEYDRDNFTKNSQNRYDLLVGYNVASLGFVTVTANVGGAFLQNHGTPNGYAALVGAEATLPLSKNLKAVVDVRHQFGQERVRAYNDNNLAAGLRYSF